MYSVSPIGLLPIGAVEAEDPGIPLEIEVEPDNVTLDLTASTSGTVEFTVAATGGTLPYTYQWYEYGVGAITEATDQTYSFTADPGDDDSVFYCIVTDDDSNTAQSANATLTVTFIEMSATAQPQDTTVDEESDVAFFFAVTGLNPITYQWYEYGEGAISGEKSSVLSLSRVSIDYDDGSQFYCIATDGYGETLESNTAELTVVSPAVSTITDVRVLGNDGIWYSISGEDGQDGSAGDLIDDSRIALDKTWSSDRINLFLTQKADTSAIPVVDKLVDEGSPADITLLVIDSGGPGDVTSFFNVIDSGGPGG